MSFKRGKRSIIIIASAAVAAAVVIAALCVAARPVSDGDAVKNTVAAYYQIQSKTMRDLRYHDLSGVLDTSTKSCRTLVTYTKIMTEKIRYSIVTYNNGKNKDPESQYTLEYKDMRIDRDSASVSVHLYLGGKRIAQWFIIPSSEDYPVDNVFYLKKEGGRWKITDYVMPFSPGEDIRKENLTFDIDAIHKDVDRDYGKG